MKKIRCAIYTRKSSEEGLEQDFNSLHAQREACAAYVMSQASEGWSLLPEEYDDGGLSGGTLERPALKRLLADIEAGRIDIVVVYKVDRLTRSLLDFAKLVETMDKAGTSFVSVTQSFNTTNSMGRLTLNMLLSFAQFEREVTAERIRDKIAASKAKGMWMGGNPPLGYRPEGRTLVIVPEHAEVIRELFRRYLAIGNVRLLTEELDAERIRVPERTTSTGRPMGGGKFTRGQIYKILSNPIYLGEIHHKGKVYAGKHEAIIDRELWDRVQAKLTDNTQGKQRAATVQSPSLLAGLVFDEAGQPLVASHACKGKVRYRYYVSRALQQGSPEDGVRIPAREIEDAVATRVAEALDQPLQLVASLGAVPDAGRLKTAVVAAERLAGDVRKKKYRALRSLLNRVEIHRQEIRIDIAADALAHALGLPALDHAVPAIIVSSLVRLTRTGMAMRLIQPDGKGATSREADRSMLNLLVKARRWWERLSEGTIEVRALAREEGVDESWVTRVVRLNFLAPEIVTAILEGNHPARLNSAALSNSGVLPARWDEQLKRFGFA
ncbi:recombinase family protein [Altericroceibacterium xinjiangense]|uniref:recombinase family protein n=1 Tax=Altericroceibacterium xinjiangense TaxID=762261 RepID=UPI000F7E1995|nr:recombinase family protein [Altericroceibacterium xinjiangense]